jgi:hypothetical protein
MRVDRSRALKLVRWLALWLIPSSHCRNALGGSNVFTRSLSSSARYDGDVRRRLRRAATCAQQAVENYGWLRSWTAGMAETTPGPLIFPVRGLHGRISARRPFAVLAGALGGAATWVPSLPALWFLGARLRAARNNRSTQPCRALGRRCQGNFEPCHLVCIHTVFRQTCPFRAFPSRSMRPWSPVSMAGAGPLGRRRRHLQQGRNDRTGAVGSGVVFISRGRSDDTPKPETDHPYSMKPLGCDPQASRHVGKLIVSHYENNYGGAVRARSISSPSNSPASTSIPRRAS